MEHQLGIRVHLRDVATLDDVANVTAPAPVEPGDVVASAEGVYAIEVVLPPTPGALCVPALVRRVDVDTRSEA